MQAIDPAIHREGFKNLLRVKGEVEFPPVYNHGAVQPVAEVAQAGFSGTQFKSAKGTVNATAQPFASWLKLCGYDTSIISLNKQIDDGIPFPDRQARILNCRVYFQFPTAIPGGRLGFDFGIIRPNNTELNFIGSPDVYAPAAGYPIYETDLYGGSFRSPAGTSILVNRPPFSSQSIIVPFGHTFYCRFISSVALPVDAVFGYEIMVAINPVGCQLPI